MALIYDSSHSGQEIDAAVDAVQTTIPSQVAQIGLNLSDLQYGLELLNYNVQGEEVVLELEARVLKPFIIEEGKSYNISNRGSKAVTISFWASESDAEAVQKFDIPANSTRTKTATGNASYIKSRVATTLTISPVEYLQNDVKKNKEQITSLGAKVEEQDESLFNIGIVDDIILHKSVKTDNSIQPLIINYLGKTDCTFTINGTVSANAKYIRVLATNKATGNTLVIRNDDSTSTFPIVFDNPRTDLELIDVKLLLLSSFVEDTLDIKVTKISPIKKLEGEVESLEPRVAALENAAADAANSIAGLETEYDELNESLFNIGIGDAVLHKTVNVGSSTNLVVIKYLGKTACTFEINGTIADNAKYIRVLATNKATGNTIAIRNNDSTSTFPITFDNPKTDLELINVQLLFLSGFVEDTLDIKITKTSPIEKLESEITGLDARCYSTESKILNATSDLWTFEKNISAVASAKYKIIDYLGKGSGSINISGNGNCHLFVTAYNEETGETVNLYRNATGYETNLPINIDIPSAYEYGIVYLTTFSQFTPADITVTIQRENQFDVIDEKIRALQSFTQDERVYLGNNSIIAVPSTSVYITRDFHIGKKYRVYCTWASSTNLIEIRLYTGVQTGSYTVVYTGSPSGDFWFDFEPEQECKSMLIYFGASTIESELALDFYYKELKRVFQFGLAANGKYDVPAQTTWSSAPTDRLGYFYGLYDALMARFPNYISKVDCATDAGIAVPDYMEDYPIYMYKFIPPYTPNTSGIDDNATSQHRLKALILSGTHPEYTSVLDLYQTMRIICEDWTSDENLQALRWEVEYYIIPCAGPYGIQHGSRTNYNGVDLNRNMPTKNWRLLPTGNTYSGASAGSEYESKILAHYFSEITPDVFIDHHNTNEMFPRILIYITSDNDYGVDVGAEHIRSMSIRWKKKRPDLFSMDNYIYGFAQSNEGTGTRCRYGYEQGALSFTYESQRSIRWSDGTIIDSAPINSADAVTLGTDGFLNFLLRVFKFVSK